MKKIQNFSKLFYIDLLLLFNLIKQKTAQFFFIGFINFFRQCSSDIENKNIENLILKYEY